MLVVTHLHFAPASIRSTVTYINTDQLTQGLLARIRARAYVCVYDSLAGCMDLYM